MLPALVYGSPPVARIDAGKLVYLRGPVPLRDVPAEGRAVERLRAELDLLPGRRTTYDGADAPRFVAKLGRWRGDLAGDAAGIVKPAATLEPRLRVISEGEPGRESVRFELTFAAVGVVAPRRRRAGATPTGSVDAAAVVRAWQEGLGIVPLGDGDWASLPIGWLQKHGQRVADLLAAREDDGRLARHSLPALAALCAELEHPPPPGLDRLAPLAEGLRAPPRGAAAAPISRRRCAPTSARGSSWLAFLRSAGLGGVLADDMGLGKTLQAMCAFDGPDAGRLPDERGVQLAGGARRASGPACKVSAVSRGGADPRCDRRRDPDQLRAAAPRREGAVGAHVERRGPRRGAGDQEPRQPDRARRVRAAARRSASR